MKIGSLVIVAAASRLFTPILALFAFVLLVGRAPGEGVGFVAGLAFGLVLVLHALTFGAAASRASFPKPLAQTALAVGAAAACAGVGLPEAPWARQLTEAGAFVATIAAAALILQALFGRASTLRDAEW